MEYIFTLIVLLLFLLFFISLYIFLTWNLNFWRKQKIPTATGQIPLFGHMWSVFLLKQSFPSLCENLYKTHMNSSIVGFFQFQTPSLIVREPELVKDILVGNFANFHDNLIKLDEKLDPSMCESPFFAKGNVWKRKRTIMTNGFSNRKLKLLFTLAKQVAYKLNVYLNNMLGEKNFVEIELLHFWTKYTGEFVTNVGFGVEGHCFDDNLINFQNTVESMFDFSKFGREREMILFFMPRLARILGISRVPKKVEDFLQKLVEDVIKSREHENIIRNDFLQMMIDYQKSHNPNNLDEKSLLVIMESFFLDAYESASIALSFICFQLANHPEIQEKVRQEVNTIVRKYNGQLDYDALKELIYMEQVFYETFRIDPVIPVFTKICTKRCQLRGSDGLVCQVETGNIAVISSYGLNTDPKYWQNPEKFDPERFNVEQISERSKYIFLPFGEGPRICVGRKMAMIELKVAMVQILMNYSLQLSKKNILPIKRDTSFSTYPKSGLWIKVKLL